MRNHLNWLILLMFGIALIGCQDDITVNNPENSSNDLNKSGQAGNQGIENAIAEMDQIGDRIWKDTNKNGIQDSGEEGFAGVTVALYECPEKWLEKVVVTDANGNYFFKDLQPGNYKVRIEIPDGWTLSPQNASSDDALDSDFIPALDNKPYTECFELSAGGSNLSLDAGLYPTTQPLTQVGDRIWKDLNKNGIQDVGEEGFPGVTVCLYKCDGAWLNMCINTDAKGNYAFKDLQPGNYKVAINIPVGWALSPQNIGDDTKDSDFGPTELNPSYTNCFELRSGEIDLTWDAGLYPKPAQLSQIGNRVWKDRDKDGIQDFGEFGIKNVKVELYDCGGNLIHTTFTDYIGNYKFKKLIPGDYKVKFYAPIDYVLTKKDQGTNDERDSDADSSTGLTKCITLGTGMSDLNWDAGLYKIEKIHPKDYGYWKTHSKYGPAPYDSTWKLIGEDTEFYLSEKSYYEVMNSNPRKGNTYYILAHQYISARLNILAGVNVPENVAAAIIKAEAQFKKYKPADLEHLRGNSELRMEFLRLAWLLNRYNNGSDHHNFHRDDDDGSK